MPLTSSEYLAHLSADGQALCAAAEVDLSAPVRSCPGWNVADLVRHTGEVHRDKAAIVRDGRVDERPRLPYPEPPAEDGEALLSWYREGLDELLAVLATDPEQTAWGWSGDHRVAFWQRRMAQETLVHRWDAQAAVGAFTGVDADLAADGVDELLRVFAPGTDEPYQGPDGTITVQCLDVEHAWTVRLSGDRLEVDDDLSLDADAVIRGSAHDLLLAMWHRLPLTEVEISGDRSLVEAFLSWIDED